MVMIDTLFQNHFSIKKSSFYQYPCGFRNFSKSCFLTPLKLFFHACSANFNPDEVRIFGI